MVTRNVVLTERQEELIATLVGSGRYQNASEVLRDGLRLIELREAEDAAKLERLRGAVQLGLDDAKQGRVTRFHSPEDLKRHLDGIAERVIKRQRRR